MKPISNFRLWVRNLWLENTEEHFRYNELPYTMQQYWTKYKWWLKREYRFRKEKGLV